MAEQHPAVAGLPEVTDLDGALLARRDQSVPAQADRCCAGPKWVMSAAPGFPDVAQTRIAPSRLPATISCPARSSARPVGCCEGGICRVTSAGCSAISNAGSRLRR